MSCSNSKCNPCGPSEDAMNAIANRANYYARVAQNAADQIAGFESLYLGAKATAPTTDNVGDPLIEGALYFNTTDDTMYAWDGTAWLDVATGFDENTSYQVTGTPTARNLATRGADVINVKDFGAVGDGVADDAPAIRAALAFAVTKSTSTVYFPYGTYNLATFEDGTTTWNSDLYAAKSILHFRNTGDLKDFNIIGDGATLTSGLWAQNPRTLYYHFNGLGVGTNKGPSTMIFLEISGKNETIIQGIEFVHRFGGTGERPLITVSNNQNFQEYGGTIAIAANESFGFPVGTDWEAILVAKITVDNCKFRDFGSVLDTWYMQNVNFKNNQITAKYGRASSVPISQHAVLNLHSGFTVNSNVSNNFLDACTERDLTFLQSSPYSSSRTVEGVTFQYGGNPSFGISGGYENFYHSGYSLRESICNNTIVGCNIESIKSESGSYATYYPEYINKTQFVANNNNINATQPLGSSIYGGNGITASVSNSTVVGNNITNCEIGVAINQQHATRNIENILISGNTIQYTAYGDTGYFSSPKVFSSTGITLEIDNGKSIIDGNNYVVRKPFDSYVGSKLTYAFSLIRNYTNDVIVSNNNITLSDLRNVNDKFVAFSSTAKGVIYKNNVISGYYYFVNNFGGTPFTISGQCDQICADNIFDGKEYLISFDGQYGFQQHKDQYFKIYPSSTGWYQAVVGNSDGGLGLFGINIRDHLYGQKTNASVSFRGFIYSQDNWITANIINNAVTSWGNSGDAVISKIALSTAGAVGVINNALFFIWFYVNKIFTSIPVKITGGGGSGASATANFTNGVLTSITSLVGGSGFTSLPTCTISPIFNQYQQYDINWTTAAVLTPTISGGQITGIAITNGGTGYGSGTSIKFNQNIFEDQSVSGGNVGVITISNIIKSDNVVSSIPTSSNSMIVDLINGSKSMTMYNPAGLSSGTPRYVLGTGIITQASGVPSSTPEFIGQDYLDTATSKFYKAKGTASSADWVALN